MNRQERIDALQKALNAINTAITQTLAALRTSTDPNDTLRLTSALTDLRAERQSTQLQLDNLNMAAGEIAAISPASVARIRALNAELDAAILNSATVSATLDFANAVLAKAPEIRNALA